MAEIIVFDGISLLSDDEKEDARHRVESYLAIKYGLTLAGRVGFSGDTTYNYVSSDSTVIWPGYTDASYAAFHHEVAGIGRDNATGGSGLLQKQSKSSLQGEKDQALGPYVTIGIDTIVADNDANTGSFNDNYDFLVWGTNLDSASATSTDTTDVPEDVVERMKRLWRVKNTGNVGAVDVQFELPTSLGYGTRDSYQLVVSSTQTMASGTLYQPTIISNSGNTIIYFDDITFSDGDYFTLITLDNSSSPGGVATGLLLWLKADKDLYTTGGTLDSILDQSGKDYHPTVPSGNEPTLSNNLINFNPAIYFDEGSGTYLQLHDYAANIFRPGSANSFFIVSSADDNDFDITFYASNDTSSFYEGLGLSGDNLEFHLHHNFGGQGTGLFLQDGVSADQKTC